MIRRLLAISTLLAVSACTIGAEGPDEVEVLTRDQFVETFITENIDADGQSFLTYDYDQPLASWHEVDALYQAYVEAHTEGELTSQAAVNITRRGLDVYPPSVAANLTYCVSDAFAGRKQQVVDALGVATSDWEASGNFDFRYAPAFDSNCTAQNSSVAFNVVPIAQRSGLLASAFFPSWQREDRQLRINVTTAFTSGIPLEGVLRHELGHAVGLRHETARVEGWLTYGTHCFEDYWLVPLTAYDASSVMVTPACVGDAFSNRDLVLSAGDRYAISLLYR